MIQNSKDFEEAIRRRKYKGRGTALQAISKTELNEKDKAYLRELVTSIYGWAPASGERTFANLKDNIEHGYYASLPFAQRAAKLSKTLTKAERSKLQKIAEAYFNGKANGREKKVRKGLKKMMKEPVTKKRAIDPRVLRQGDYISVFLEYTNDSRFVDKFLGLARAAVDASSTLPALISAVEIRRKELKAS